MEIFPCGKCLECRKQHSAGWAFRIQNELKYSTKAYFITLTYDTDHVPITKNGLMTLQRSHVQAYFKRLRKDGLQFKYYCMGEYGSKRKRPHYHIIMMFKGIINSWDVEKKIHKHWNLGEVHIGKGNESTIKYTLKYITKGKVVPQFKNDDRQQERSLSSIHLGINYVNEKSKNWHKADLYNRFYLPEKDGIKVKMIRYYKEKLYPKVQRDKISNYWKLRHEYEEEANEKLYELLNKVNPLKKVKEKSFEEKALILTERNNTILATWKKQQKEKQKKEGKF